MIRRAGLTDVSRIVQMGERFIAETEYREFVPINRPAMTAWVTQLVGGSVGLDATVFVEEKAEEVVGMFGLFIYPSPLTGQIEAVETFWWVEPEHRRRGLRLLAAAEQWAREGGALALRMIAPTPKVERLYERLGFRHVEASYVRAIT